MNAVLAALPTEPTAPWADLRAEPDAEHLRAVLQRELAGFEAQEREIVDVRVSKVRRSSSIHRNPHPISMLLDLDVRDAATGRCGTERYYAKAYRAGASASAFAGIDRSALAAPAIGAPLSLVSALDMLLWAWPNDPSLPQLARLLDPDRLPAVLPQGVNMLGHATGGAEVLRHEPERRATLRCAMRTAGATGPESVFYGKTFCDEGSALALLERFEYFWQLSQVDAAAPCVGRPLGWDRPTRTYWQAAAPGQPLMARTNTVDALTGFEAIGRALAKLHLAPLATSAQRSTVHWLAEVQRRVQKISRAAPALANRAQNLAAMLETAAMQLPRARQTLIHGDFHPDQVWLHGDRVVFFDFDEFALGNPMEDLAEFIVKLEQHGGAATHRQSQVASLLAGYCAVAPRFFYAQWLQWHRAVQTLLQASRAFIYQQPDWRTLMDARLAASEQLASTLLLKGAA